MVGCPSCEREGTATGSELGSRYLTMGIGLDQPAPWRGWDQTGSSARKMSIGTRARASSGATNGSFPNVQAWLAEHPRFSLHFIPTSSSWLNLIERWFAELSQKAVRRGVFRSVEDLEQAIAAFLAAWNTNPTPFVWTASVEKILEKIARARRRLEQIQLGCTSPKRRTNCVAN